MLNQSFGATATISIRHEGDLDQLAQLLSRCLEIGEIVVEPSKYPPYEMVGSAEGMGMELWLNRTSSTDVCLKMQTTNSHEEIFAGRMYDLSVWLSRLVRTACDLDASPVQVSSSS